MYWSTSNGNGLWRSNLDGSGAIAVLTDDIQTIGKHVWETVYSTGCVGASQFDHIMEKF